MNLLISACYRQPISRNQTRTKENLNTGFYKIIKNKNMTTMVIRSFFVLTFAIFAFTISPAQSKERLPRFQEHYVRERETPSSISSDFSIKTRDFLLLNNFPADVKLKPGQKVLIRVLKDGETVEKETPYSAPRKNSADEKNKPDEATKKPQNTKKESAATSKGETTTEMLVGPNGAKYELSSGGFHVVQKGQTFYRIALIYHISIDQLKKLNNMTTTDIKVGQELKISN